MPDTDIGLYIKMNKIFWIKSCVAYSIILMTVLVISCGNNNQNDATKKEKTENEVYENKGKEKNEEGKNEEGKTTPETTELKGKEIKQSELQPVPNLSEDWEYLKKNDVWSSSANSNSKSLVSVIQRGEADAILNHPYSKLNDKTRQNGYWLEIMDRVKEMKVQGRESELKSALQSVYKDPLNLREVNDKLARMKK